MYITHLIAELVETFSSVLFSQAGAAYVQDN